MSKTVLAVQSYGAARDRVWRHFPYYQKSGGDILGVNTHDTIHDWPEGCFTIEIGHDGYLNGTDHLCRRILDTMAYLLREPRYEQHTHFLLMEQDSIFVRPAPEFGPGLTTPYRGFCAPSWNFHSVWFIHFPWIMDRSTAQLLLEAGNRLLERGIFDGGTPDAFLGSMIAEAGEQSFQWNQFPQDRTVFSVNSGSFSEGASGQALRESFVNSCRTDKSLFFLHGVKHAEELTFFQGVMEREL